MEADDVIILSSPDMGTPEPGPSRPRIFPIQPPNGPPVFELSDSEEDIDHTSAKQRPRRNPMSASSGTASNAARENQGIGKGKGKAREFILDDTDIEMGEVEELRCVDHERPLTMNRDYMARAPQPAASVPRGHASREPPPHTLDTCLARILEVVPDVEPEHALSLLRPLYVLHQERAIELVLHNLFENIYPKVNKAKRKRDESDDESAAPRKVKIDYASKERPFTGGIHYQNLTVEQLLKDFPQTPVAYIRKAIDHHNGLYAPTYLYLASKDKPSNLHPRRDGKPSSSKNKGPILRDEEFENERKWLLLKLQDDKAEMDRQVAETLNEREYEETGDGIECGCCFSTYPFDMMVQCPEAHLFCRTCIKSYAETQLGEHNPNITCIDQSGCKVPFTDSELRRFLTPKLLELYERVKQLKEIEAAQIEGLEECPFCEYKVVIENEQEKLFRCERRECGAVSCRQCKKLDHLPKNCKEAEEEKHLDGQHKIEEAMTKALMRNCPKCQKAFIKDQGCNKMICPNCHTMSCYICRQAITGYEHFAQNVPNMGQPGPSTVSGKCALWDSVEERHANEVNEAAKKAMEEYKRQNPGATDEDLRIQLAKAPQAPVHNARPGMGFGVPAQMVPHVPFGLVGFGVEPPWPAPPIHPHPYIPPPAYAVPAPVGRPRYPVPQPMRRARQPVIDAQARMAELEARRDAMFEAHVAAMNRFGAARRQVRR